MRVYSCTYLRCRDACIPRANQFMQCFYKLALDALEEALEILHAVEWNVTAALAKARAEGRGVYGAMARPAERHDAMVSSARPRRFGK